MGANAFMESALALAARQLRVFPLIPGTKQPACEGWQDMASADPERIRQWWSDDQMVIGFTKGGKEVDSNPCFNIGVATGRGVLGLDADVKKGKPGIESARALGVDFSGFAVRTPSGGMHEYFLGPDVTNSVERLGRGVDIRSAGGFLVGPGSTLPEGVYVVEAANDIRQVPPAVVHRLTASEIERSSAPSVTPDLPDAVDRGVTYLTTQAPQAVEGAGGDATTFRVAAHLKDFGVSEDMAVDLMAEHWNDRCSPPWDIEDLKTKVRNAYEYGARPLGDLHPMADFAGVKIDAPEAQIQGGLRWFRHGDSVGKIEWLYWQMLPKTGVGVLLAPTQAGKTFLAIHLAWSLGTGEPFFRESPDDRGATLFVFAGTEGSGFELRLEALASTSRLPISSCTLEGNLSDNNALPELLVGLQAEARRVLAEFGLPVRLIVLETMASTGLLRDENDNAEASRALANLGTISRHMNALVLTSHHPDKSGKSARGASAIPNSADAVLEIKRPGEEKVRELLLTKARNAEQRKLGTFTLNPVNLGQDARGRPITSMVVSTGEVMSNAVRMAAHAEKFIEALEWATVESGFDLPDGRQGVLERHAKDSFHDRVGGSGDASNLNKKWKPAMAWFQQLGRIDVVPYGGDRAIVLKAPISVEVAA